MTLYCGYCLLPHERDSSGCCPGHARKVGAAKAAATRRFNRVVHDEMQRAYHTARVRPLWRQIAMTDDFGPLIDEVFHGRP